MYKSAALIVTFQSDISDAIIFTATCSDNLICYLKELRGIGIWLWDKETMQIKYIAVDQSDTSFFYSWHLLGVDNKMLNCRFFKRIIEYLRLLKMLISKTD